MAARDVRKNLNLFVDGRGYAGQVQDFNAPKLNLVTEEFRGGGMDVPIEITMGLEALTADFGLISYDKDVLALFGVAEGATVPFVVREALQSEDGSVTGVVHTMRGKIKSMDPGTSQPGQTPAVMRITLALKYYRLVHGSTTIHEIDAENMVRTINGVDALADMRKALGI